MKLNSFLLTLLIGWCVILSLMVMQLYTQLDNANARYVLDRRALSKIQINQLRQARLINDITGILKYETHKAPIQRPEMD